MSKFLKIIIRYPKKQEGMLNVQKKIASRTCLLKCPKPESLSIIFLSWENFVAYKLYLNSAIKVMVQQIYLDIHIRYNTALPLHRITDMSKMR